MIFHVIFDVRTRTLFPSSRGKGWGGGGASLKGEGVLIDVECSSELWRRNKSSQKRSKWSEVVFQELMLIHEAVMEKGKFSSKIKCIKNEISVLCGL